LTGDSKTIDLSALPAINKYQSIDLPVSSVTCVKSSTAASLSVSDGKATFTEAGVYTVTYTYTDSAVYDKDGNPTGTETYTKTISVDVHVKEPAPNGVITCSSANGTVIWGTAGIYRS